MRELGDHFSTSFNGAVSLSSCESVIDQLLFDDCSHRAVYYFMSDVNWP